MNTTTNGSELLLSSLTSYYQKNPDKYEILYDVIQGKSRLSLRIIDWFVTHYAKTYNTVYWIDDSAGKMYQTPVDGDLKNLRKFHVYLDTRAQLKSYTKLHFDPFRRHQRISFFVDTKPFTKVVETTIGQLNFFRWALQNCLLEYIEQHIEDIERSLISYQKKGGAPDETSMHKSPPNTVIRAHFRIRFD